MTDDLSLPPGMDLQADVALAVAAAREAGAAVLPAFREGREVRYKGPNQPVTEADLRADRMLREALLGARPGYGWLSEETADSPERLGREVVWVVDPIDGTNAFVEGLPDWVVCVGLVLRGEVVAGVVHNPSRGETYHAVRGGGAFLDGRPVRASATVPGDPAPRLLASLAETGRGDFAPFAAAGWRVKVLGSTAYRMARVAAGEADAFVSRGAKSEWDLCAPALLLAEAGGRATDGGGAPLRFNRPDPSFRGVAATNGHLHDTVLALAAQLPRAG